MASNQAKRNKAEERARRAAELRKEQERKERMRQLKVGGAVVLGIALIVGLGFAIMKLTDNPTPDRLEGTSEEYALALGEEDAPSQVVIYEDFLCPACGALEAATVDTIQQGIDDGTIAVEYRPFELLGRLGDYSRRSANAFKVVLDASGPEVAKAYHDALFANQPPEQEPYPDDQWLIDLAVEAGADEAAIRPGIEGQTQMQWVNGATGEAADIGVNGTPTVYIDGELVEGTTLQDTADAIAEVAEK